MSNFNTPIDRRGTSSQKWEKYQGRDIIPLWVADTDFQAPPAVLQALQQRVDHGVFGYTLPPQALTDAVVARLQHLYHWKVDPQWIVWLPGLVCGLHLACRSVGSSQDQVLAPVPIYPPFMSAPRLSDRDLVQIPMRQEKQRWLLDLDALEAALTPRSRVLLFCNPHNPGGTVYRREELERLVALCRRHDLKICSDEIHCDLLLEAGLRHTPLASLDEDAALRSMTLLAPSKTFNIAGLACSLAVVPDEAWRRRLRGVMRGIVPDVNLLGYTAALAAYRDGDAWNQQQLAYLRENRDLLMREISTLPGLRLLPIEATYLAWIDISALNLRHPAAFFEEAGVGLSPGADFGDRNFMRLNFGCTRDTLREALRRIRVAVERHVNQEKPGASGSFQGEGDHLIDRVRPGLEHE